MEPFNGLHYETGSVHNALALRGITAPHTGKPVSEALLLGISGGAAFGYFTFEYTGHAPQLVLLTRNTFDTLETLFDRLALSREVLQTAKPDKAEENLRRVLESGCPALVWADMFSLPYAATPEGAQMWAMVPVVVTAIENGEATVIDRSRKPFRVPLDALTAARGRVKDDRYRVVCLDTPDFSKLTSAVQKGIWQAISLYVDAPPKGKRDNFGLAAYQHWADMLTNTRNKMSWERYFPVGPRLSSALVGHSWQSGAFDYIRPTGAADSAERDLYADFLDEAALILNKPGLNDAATQFRAAGQAWRALSEALLPDRVPVLRAIRDVKLIRRAVWLELGGEGAAEFAALTAQMRDQTAALEQAFPMSEAEARDFRAGLREHVLKIHDIERDAVAAMQGAMN